MYGDLDFPSYNCLVVQGGGQLVLDVEDAASCTVERQCAQIEFFCISG